MAEANDGVEYWISMIKDHVDFDGSEGQEVHDFYSGLDDAKQQSFNQFMRKEKNRIITGIEVQKASGGGTNKYLKIDMNVFKSCLKIFNININYISCGYREVEGARGGKMNCVIIENSQIRFLKNNMMHSI